MNTSFGNWELRKKLGAGGFGEVILWKNRMSQKQIATKFLNKNEQLGTDEVRKLNERWTQEIYLMHSLNADFIVSAIELDDKAFVSYLNERHAWHPLPVLIMEYCNGGDLRTQLQKNENLNGLCEFEVREVLRSLRNALDFMHNKCKIQHRDLKPDNIVIHKMDNGKKVYKLTDFGFARYVNDQTMLLSVVGTRNYFAPEIVDTGGYTKTVDYWSVGVMAFEMLCGVLPFIPHQTLFNKIKQIKEKPENCIAITEDPENKQVFKCHTKIFNENRVSDTFRHDIEKWLTLSLDINHRTRGTSLVDLEGQPFANNERQLRFYSDLDVTLNTRVLTTFCLFNYKFFYYKVDERTEVASLIQNIARDSGIDLKSLYFILPVNHPLKSINNMQHALDLFVPDWCDTSDMSNPPAMLFIGTAENNFLPTQPQISEVIRHCFAEPTINDAVDEAPRWLLQKFAQDINFLLTNEQRHLAAFLNGLQQYAINVEHKIFELNAEMKNLHSRSFELKGMVLQLVNSLLSLQKLHTSGNEQANSFYKSWQQISENLQSKIETIVTNIVPKLQKRFNSAQRRMKEQANIKLYENLIKSDIYDIANFQRHFQGAHLKYKFEDLTKKTSACNKCRSYVHNVLEKRADFFENKQIECVRFEIVFAVEEFMKLKEATTEACAMLGQMHKAIADTTLNFYKELIKYFETQMATPPPTTIDGLCDAFDHLMEIPTRDLIQESQESIRLMSMDFDLDQPLEEIS